MTRKDYLKTLELQLSSLPYDEREEALKYYEDYFEDAGNDEAVMAELGTPEQLAQSITSKIAGVPSVKDMPGSKEYKANQNGSKVTIGPFDAASIKNLNINVKAGELRIVKDSSFYIECEEGMEKDGISVIQNKDTLYIETNKNFKKSFRIFSFNINSRRSAEMVLHLPEGIEFNQFCADIGFGEFNSHENAEIKAGEFNLKVGAGEIALDHLKGGNVVADCGMGEINLKGKFTGNSQIKCGMGEVSILVTEKPDNYSIDGSVGLGELCYNGMEKAGSCSFHTERKDNHFKVEVGMGEVQINFTQK